MFFVIIIFEDSLIKYSFLILGIVEIIFRIGRFLLEECVLWNLKL